MQFLYTQAVIIFYAYMIFFSVHGLLGFFSFWDLNFLRVEVGQHFFAAAGLNKVTLARNKNSSCYGNP